ncbi:MAG: acyltransferase [Zetaproteobacteria bacterium]|nr:MAG: acyltransferase [Zetaproteobacteria bacterium]
MVILAHAISSVPVENSFVVKILDFHLDNCTVLFIAIAGYFFSVLSGGYCYSSFLNNKFKAVIIPYIVISVPAILLYLLKIKTYHYWIDMDWFYSGLGPVGQYAYLMITGAHLGPLWFVPMIILFYVLSPLFIHIQNNGWLSVVFFLSLCSAIYFGRPQYNDNVLQSFTFFLPAYVFGMLLAKKTWLYESITRYSGWLLGGYVAVVSLLYATIDISSSVDLVVKLLLAVLLLAFCKQTISHKVVWLDLCARLSFFLFFIHGYFTGFSRVFMKYYDIQAHESLAVTVIFIFTVVMSLLSYIVAKLILKDKTRMLLGA